MSVPAVRYQPRDDYDAAEMYLAGIGGAAETMLSLIFLPEPVLAGQRWARLGVLQRVLEQGLPVPKVAVVRALHDVRLLRGDSHWAKTWPDVRKARRALDALTVALDKVKRTKPHILYSETLFPPRVLAALAEKIEGDEDEEES